MSVLDAEQKKRLNKVLRKVIFFLILGIAYYIYVLCTGTRIPCPIMHITEKYCPGCGITRMFMCLGKLDFHGAIRNNILVMCLIPPAAVWGTYRGVCYVKNNKTSYSKLEIVTLILIYIVVVAFWIMRNMQAFSYLAPIE